MVFFGLSEMKRLSETAGFALGFEEAEDVVFADCGDSNMLEDLYIGSEKVDVPGPLTLRMMERVWSSMNSTRTWVTPPREPVKKSISFLILLPKFLMLR